MKKIAIALSLIVFVFATNSSYGDEIDNPRNFSFGLLAGYTPLPMLVYSVAWKNWEEKQENVDVSDDSYINPAPMGGLSFTYLPATKYITAGLTLEGFFFKHQGALKGAYGDNRQNRENYNVHMALDFYQINMLCSLYFTDNAFKPYLQFGIGAVRSDGELGSYHQTIYGAAGIISWGGQYSFTDWFALGGQIRTQDIFGLTFFYEPSYDNLTTIEAQVIPLSFLLHTSFYF